ncbi:MAG: STAS domain-containing protein [Chitinispirillaceae bacterium]|nr:STAS domain-containing protein [Chitinispirillaceae bacterium]
MGAVRMQAERSQYQGMESIRISGPFDTQDPIVEEYLKQILEEGKISVVFDLSYTSYLSSPGIGILIKAIKWFHSVSGAIYIVGATRDIREFLTLSRIDSYVKCI